MYIIIFNHLSKIYDLLVITLRLLEYALHRFLGKTAMQHIFELVKASVQMRAMTFLDISIRHRKT